MGWPAASDEMCAVPGLQRRRTLEPIVAVTEIGFSPGAGVPDLDVRWIHGSAAAKYNTDPDIQVHACDEHTYILRQNKAVHYEAPFMFLLFGSSRALLLDTGATAYPGRLYVYDWAAFARSIDRLAGFCAQRPVRYLLGCHIEMTRTPGVDYPVGWTYQPDETPLELTADHLTQIKSTLKAHN